MENILILYPSVFLPRLIYNCESWSNMTPKDYKVLQSAQLYYLRNVMEVSRATPTDALFLELGILPVRFETEKKTVIFLPRLIYNCESWSNMTPKDYKVLQSAQLYYLRNVMEVSRATPTDALFLELGILPVRFETEKKTVIFLQALA